MTPGAQIFYCRRWGAMEGGDQPLGLCAPGCIPDRCPSPRPSGLLTTARARRRWRASLDLVPAETALRFLKFQKCFQDPEP